MKTILKVQDLTVKLKKDEQRVLVNRVSFALEENACLGILGESGSGKTMLCRAILGLLDANFTITGQAIFKGRDLMQLSKLEMQSVRGKSCCMVLQNPMTAFDPTARIGMQMTETFLSHKSMQKKQAIELALDVLARMQLKHPEELLEKYPHQLSGGMLQRVMIAIALALEPDLIIADEPTTALDSITQFEVMEEFVRIRETLKTAMIFISHDLGVISRISDHILVMDKGNVVEEGSKKKIFCQAEKEYTRYLIQTRMALMEKYRLAVRGEEKKG